jgi:mono/diheme cytochrome c family protein
MLPAPGGGALIAFQEEQTTEVRPERGGYGSGCRSIVRSAVSMLRVDGTSWTALGLDVVLPLDLAVTPQGNITVISGTATTTLPTRSLAATVDIVPPNSAEPVDVNPCGTTLRFEEDDAGTAAVVPPGFPVQPEGQLVAIAYDGLGRRIVQTREPYALVVGERAVTLPGDSRKDTGHQLFHFVTGGGLACASCHPEGREDGHVWNFAMLGARRTQSLGGGILGTEPFHWSGDMTDFPMLAHEVFGARMSGPALLDTHVQALGRWIDNMPAIRPNQGLDSASVERGRASFQDPTVGCATCHTGAKFTNNKTVDVGTGGLFQVPSLLGVAWRDPYLHAGCAPTLEARFGACGGSELHGHTASLSASDRADLIAYLKSL